MRSLREHGRRLRLAIGLILAAATFSAGLALAASETIVGQGSNTYSANTYTTDQGEVVQFQVTGSTHNVTASELGPDGKGLFRSQTISGGTTPVSGTQYLTAGNYTFICTIHPSTMQATLQVTNNGTPAPRPQATLTVKRKKISKVLKRGLLVGIDISAKLDGVSLVAKLGGTVIARANALALAAGKQFEVVKLNKAGKSKLRRRAKAAITVTADVPFGSPASVRTKLT